MPVKPVVEIAVPLYLLIHVSGSVGPECFSDSRQTNKSPSRGKRRRVLCDHYQRREHIGYASALTDYRPELWRLPREEEACQQQLSFSIGNAKFPFDAEQTGTLRPEWWLPSCNFLSS
ncbi:unnamed protein product [Pleuronectes platessa]|uniref:Secreted protein n=1 Tax=Pleuronectes platessa TaxID=8262 RepID=A0A9N7W4W7_PLEPL|nr:unnamed protein product [Pleuronectes platessa]